MRFVEEVEYEANQVSLCCHAGCVSTLIRSRSTNEREKKKPKPQPSLHFQKTQLLYLTQPPRKAVSLRIGMGSLPAGAKLPTRKKT